MMGSAAGQTAAISAPGQADGETIYRGLFFGQGDLAALAAKVWLGEAPLEHAQTEDPELRATVAALQDDMIRGIQENEPAFFEELRAALTSGNHVHVDRTLDRAASVTRTAFENVADQPVHASLESNSELQAEEAAIVVVVYRTYVAAVHKFAAVWRVRVAVYPAVQDEPVSALARDEAVARLVGALGQS
jgi:SdpC family antimicrobial peptide